MGASNNTSIVYQLLGEERSLAGRDFSGFLIVSHF